MVYNWNNTEKDLKINLIIKEFFVNMLEYSNSGFIIVNVEFND